MKAYFQESQIGTIWNCLYDIGTLLGIEILYSHLQNTDNFHLKIRVVFKGTITCFFCLYLWFDH